MAATKRTATPAPPPQSWARRATTRVGQSIRDNLMLLFIIVDSFASSYGNIMRLASENGVKGWEVATTSLLIDVWCFICADERQRDKRRREAHPELNLPKSTITAPVFGLVLGVAATIAISESVAPHSLWGHFFYGLPGTIMMGGILLAERRGNMAVALAKAIREHAEAAARNTERNTEHDTPGNAGNSDSDRSGGQAAPPKAPKAPKADEWLPPKADLPRLADVEGIKLAAMVARAAFVAHHGRDITQPQMRTVLGKRNTLVGEILRELQAATPVGELLPAEPATDEAQAVNQ